jgi:hypothetical protein
MGIEQSSASALFKFQESFDTVKWEVLYNILIEPKKFALKFDSTLGQSSLLNGVMAL